MKDLIITLPGILGSELSVDGDDLWKPGIGLVPKLMNHRRWLEQLVLDASDDLTQPFAPDGARPEGPIKTLTIVPGLVEIDGYEAMHQAVRSAFPNAVEGDPLHPDRRLDGKDSSHGPPNYFQFAYDWRRDARASAMRLNDLIKAALPAWQADGNPDAKVVLIGHSLGGLIARYYLYGNDLRTDKPFHGWQHVREVLTFGTPYRGSLLTFGFVLHGYRKLFREFTEAVRSYPSVYQLMPRYRAVWDAVGDSEWLYPHEIYGQSGFDPHRAHDAYHDFHLLMDKGMAAADSDVQRITVPMIGFGHPTINSATMRRNRVSLSNTIPSYFDDDLAGGDGVVPLASALPPESDDHGARPRYVNQRHGSLQADPRTLEAEIEQRLRRSQRGTAEITSGECSAMDDFGPRVGLAGPAMFLDGEEPYITIETSGVATDADISVEVRDAQTGWLVQTDRHTTVGRVLLTNKPGDYRVEVSCEPGHVRSTSFYTVVDVPNTCGGW